MELQFTLPGAPRTKKNHGIIPAAQIRRGGFVTILPSQEWRDWFEVCKLHLNRIRADLRSQGVDTPIEAHVSLTALFYRHADVGDACGFYQGLGDVLEWTVKDKTDKQFNQYLGIIKNDRQIRDWDGSRLLVDSVRPRVEVTMRVLEKPQGALF